MEEILIIFPSLFILSINNSVKNVVPVTLTSKVCLKVISFGLFVSKSGPIAALFIKISIFVSFFSISFFSNSILFSSDKFNCRTLKFSFFIPLITPDVDVPITLNPFSKNLFANANPIPLLAPQLLK